MEKNLKSINFEIFGGIDGYLRLTSQPMTRASLLKAYVPWLYKAVTMTAAAISEMPFEIVNDAGEVVDTSTDWSNELGFSSSPRRLISLVAGALCGGSAYIIPEKTSRRIINLQYVSPHTITPYITSNGIEYFQRNADKGQSIRLLPDELMYFWLPDSDVEIGAPIASPMSAALQASELLASVNATMKVYGDRGFVPAYIGNVKGMPSDPEKKKAEDYLTRFLRGAYNSVVKLINSESLELIRVGAGMEELKGAYTEVYTKAIEDIGTAFGIPAALFMSDKAFASEVNSLTRTWYETSIFVSIYHTIEETFNEQLLNRYGARMQFKPEALNAFQADENARSQSVSTYTSAIAANPQIAAFVMDFMGVDLDEEQEHELEEIIKGQDEATEPDVPNEDTMPDEAETAQDETPALSPDETKDLALWYSRAITWHKQNKGGAVEWECKHLRPEISEPIRLKLASAKNELDIVKAFELGKVEHKEQSDNLLALADAINNAADKVTTETKTAAPVYNFTMPDIKVNAYMPNGDPAQVVVNVPKQDTPIINVAAPVVNNDVTVQPAAPAVNNITVQSADVVIPPMPTEATITDKQGNTKTLKVKK